MAAGSFAYFALARRTRQTIDQTDLKAKLPGLPKQSEERLFFNLEPPERVSNLVHAFGFCLKVELVGELRLELAEDGVVVHRDQVPAESLHLCASLLLLGVLFGVFVVV